MRMRLSHPEQRNTYPSFVFLQIAEQTNSRGDFAGGKGTGGTPLLDFLRPLKEDARSFLFK